MGTTRVDLAGRRFGLLTALAVSHSTNSVYWHCRCDCGADVVRRGGDLLRRERNGLNQSCGCVNSRVRKDGCIKCGKCKEFKQPFEFAVARRNPVGRHGHCKACQANWRRDNSSLLSRLSKEWLDRNPDRVKQRARDYRQKRPDYYAARESCRRAEKLRATPPWAEIDAIRLVYKKAAELGMEVDHVVPLKSDIVCGLHCWANLQLLVKPENSSKNNRHWPDMP